MKIFSAIILLILSLGNHVRAQTAQIPQSVKDEQNEIARLEAIEFATWTPQDPWREIDQSTNYARGGNWKQFVGKVVEVQPGGIRILGTWGEPDRTYYRSEDYNYSDFFVEGFPYAIAENDVISEAGHYTALEGGTYSYLTTQGGRRTIHKLIYGTPCSVPPELIAQQKAAMESAAKARAAAQQKKKQTARDNTLKWNQQQADAGDPYGLLRMGERYRDGDGVLSDREKARDYLTRSAAAGNQTAKEELQKLAP